VVTSFTPLGGGKENIKRKGGGVGGGGGTLVYTKCVYVFPDVMFLYHTIQTRMR